MPAVRIDPRIYDIAGVVVNGVTVIDENGNIDAPITTTDLTTTGNTTLGDAVSDTTTINGQTMITTTSAKGLTVGRQGDVDPVLKINAATASVATGISIEGAAAAGGVAIYAISSGTDESLTIDAKGTGTIGIGSVSTGAVTITPATNHLGTVTVGVDGTGHDVIFYGATAGRNVTWDESADELLVDAKLTCDDIVTINAGGRIVSSVNTGTAEFVTVNTQQAITGSGAITLTEYNTTLNTTGGGAYTLADSTMFGQKKRIQMIVDGGDGTVTFNTTATIVFADVGDVAELTFNGVDWIPTALYNLVDGATAPVYTP